MTRHRAAIIAVATVFSIDLFPFDRSPPMAHRSTGVFDDRPCRSWDSGSHRSPRCPLGRRVRGDVDRDGSGPRSENALHRGPHHDDPRPRRGLRGVVGYRGRGSRHRGLALGIVGGIAAAAVVVPLVRRLPSRPRPEGPRLVGRLLWEGVVYGMAEALLLATLPVLAVWQGAQALGWTDPGVGATVSGALAIVGALIVIAVHHLGYRQFRCSRKMMAGALAACGIQALAFLLSGNVLAPILAHIVLHGQLTLRGEEMPPSRGSQESRRGGRITPVGRSPRREELVA